VKATCLAPGVTKTEFFAEAEMEDTLLVKLGMMDAGAVARAGYRGFRAGRRIVVPGIINKIGAESVRFGPRFLVRKITARLNRSL
jgi:short-subunit dehydrogenase